jgi:hypothetical protein
MSLGGIRAEALENPVTKQTKKGARNFKGKGLGTHPQKRPHHTHLAGSKWFSNNRAHKAFYSCHDTLIFFFFWWGLLHGPQQGPDRMMEKTYKTGKKKTPA